MIARAPEVSLPALLLLGCMLSCGRTSRHGANPPGEPVAGIRGGQRLQAIFFESEDGVGAFQHFHDTALDLDCNFRAAESGLWRCLPDGAGAARVSEVVYTDAECTEPHVALFQSDAGLNGCTPPRHAVIDSGCGETPRVFEVGPAAPAETRYRLEGGVCAVSTQGTDYLTSLVAVTPVALEAFASARLQAAGETGGVLPLDLESEDGAGVRHGFRDALEGFDCHLQGPEGASRCVPVEVGLAGFLFGDAGCTEPAAMPISCGTSRTEIGFARALYGDDVTYHRGGPRLSASYTGSPASCQPSPDSVAFRIGAAIPITRFAAGQRTLLAGEDLTATIEAVGTASLPARNLRSTAHGGHDCHVALGSDGERRCLPPPEMFVDGYFADATCTQPVESTQAEVLALSVPEVCPATIRVYARGELHPKPVYAVTDGVCSLAHDRPPNDSPKLPYYVFPTEIPAAEFALLARVAR